MAQDIWAADAAEHFEADHSRDDDYAAEPVPGLRDEQPHPPASLICPDTGKLTMHSTDDLRAMLDRFRLGNSSASSSPTTPKPMSRKTIHGYEMVMVDDELIGSNGEYLAVDAVSDDMKFFTLHCYVTGEKFKRAADDLYDDIESYRLKVLRYGDPDVPPEWE